MTKWRAETIWRCCAIGVWKDDLVHPDSVPFNPSWSVIFNSAFGDLKFEKYHDDSGEFETSQRVKKWAADNAAKRVLVYRGGEVICEDETDANLLFLTFR